MYSIVEITWLDSQGWSGWRKVEEVLREAKEPDCLLHKSVGYLIEMNHNFVLICQSFQATDENSIADLMAIPAVVVREIKYWSVENNE